MRARRFAFTPCLDVLSSRIAPSSAVPTDLDPDPAPAVYSSPDGGGDASSSDLPSALGPTPEDGDYDPYCCVVPNTAYTY
jgi:hypothetical protein